MSEYNRIFSISILGCLALACFHTGLFLWFGTKAKTRRHTLILFEVFTGFLLLFDALAYFYRGADGQVGYYMVRVSNFLVFVSNFTASFLLCVFASEAVISHPIDFSLAFKPGASQKRGVPIQLAIVSAVCLVGIVLTVVSQFTNLWYYFDEQNVYHRNTWYPLSVALGFLPGIITITMTLQNRKRLERPVFVSLLVYFLMPFVGVILLLLVYGFSWVNISLGLGALHLFFSHIRIVELGSDSASISMPAERLFPNAGEGAKEGSSGQEKRARSHLWQTVSATLAGTLLILAIVSITGITLPEKTLVIEEPYSVNVRSNPVSVTFIRNAEKHWVDGDDPDRIGAQYDGVIYNNMKSAVITDWNFSIEIPEGCSVDPGAWNGTFSLLDGVLNVEKPHENDAENLHGENFYTVTPLKTLGFGCIMYTPFDYNPLKQKITFTYASVLRPLSNLLFDVLIVLLSIAFIVATTIALLERRLLQSEEERRKLEQKVEERTHELRIANEKAEYLLLNILPAEIAAELTEHPDRTIAKNYPNATVLFTDIVGFTKMSGGMSAEEVVTMLNKMISMFDERAKREGIEKSRQSATRTWRRQGLPKMQRTTARSR